MYVSLLFQMQKTFFYLLILVIVFHHSLFSQNSTITSDTLMYNGRRIIVNSNKSWAIIDSIQIYTSDTVDYFQTNWDNDQLYVYTLENMYKPREWCLFDIAQLDPAHFTVPYQGKLKSRFNPHQQGIDIQVKTGEPVLSAFDGRVRYAFYNQEGYGNLIIIRHENGLETWYGHLSSIKVKINEDVKSGQLIGTGGMTGRASSSSLHFETRFKDRAFDPLSLIDFDNHRLNSNLPIPMSDDVLLLSKPNENTSQANRINEKEQTNSKPVTIKKNTTSTVKPKLYHKIKKGDSLNSISKKYGTTVDKLCMLNHISKNFILIPGKKLIVK